MCFLTCWLAIPALGITPSFTPWGIASGLFWVPGATAGIYGIRNAGLSVAVGTWSALAVISSFFWGVVVFREKVRSPSGTCGAAVTLCAGLVGMSRYSAPLAVLFTKKDAGGSGKMDVVTGAAETVIEGNDHGDTVALLTANYDDEELSESESPPSTPSMQLSLRRKRAGSSGGGNSSPTMLRQLSSASYDDSSSSLASMIPLEMESLSIPPVVSRKRATDSDSKTNIFAERPGLALNGAKRNRNDWGDEKVTQYEGGNVMLFNGRLTMTRRQLGILAAMVNGLWGGTSLIPMHYAR